MLSFYLAMIDSPEEQDKFILIYNEYKNIMLNCAYSILKDKSDAEDAVHDAFLRILKNLHKIDKISCPKTQHFIVIIVQNVAKTLIKKKNKIRKLELIEDITGIKRNSVEEEFDAEFVAQCIKNMPEIYRDVLVLKYLNDCSTNEIAKILGISKYAVEKRLQRAKKMLGDMLDEQ